MSEVQIIPQIKPFRFKCHLCFEEYNKQKRKPLMVCPELHTFCESCIHARLLNQKDEDSRSNCLQCGYQFSRQSLLQCTILDHLTESLSKQGKDILEPKEKNESEEQNKTSLQEQLTQEKNKIKWLLKYCIQLDSTLQDVSAKQKNLEIQFFKKDKQQQKSLERLAIQFWRLKGDKQFEEENFGNMIEFSQQIISSHPTYDYNSHGFGNLEDQIGMFEVEPVKWYISGRQERNFRSSPYDILSLCYLITKNHEEAQQWYTSQLSKSHENYQLLIGMANTKYNLGKYEQSERLYKRIIELRPEMDRPYQQLAFINCVKKNNKKEGRGYAEKALQHNPNNVYAKFLLATTQDNYDTQIEKLQEIITNRKTYARAYNGLGTIYKQKGDYEESLKWYKKAIQINPKYDAPYYGIGLISFSKEDFQQAIKWFQESIKVNPRYQNAFYGIGSCFNKLGDKQQAITWYKQCININQNNSRVHNALGTIYAIMQRYEQALQHLKKCILINPKHTLCLNSLGNVSFYKGNLQEAIKYYEQCIQINPKYTAPYNGLSNLYYKKGNQEQAKRWYEKQKEAGK